MKTLLAKLEEMKSLKRDRLVLKRQMEMLEQQEKILQANAIQEMNELGITELNGVTLKTTVVPQLADWSLLEQYIRKYDAVDLLQKRLTPTAVRLRWEEGIEIPGVDKYEETKLSY